MELIDKRENIKRFSTKSKNSLQSLSMEKIIFRREEICQAADETGINPLESLGERVYQIIYNDFFFLNICIS
jgi:hypothetical protein